MLTFLCILRDMSFLVGVLAGVIGSVMDDDSIFNFGVICFLITTIFGLIIQVTC